MISVDIYLSITTYLRLKFIKMPIAKQHVEINKINKNKLNFSQ